MKKILFFITLFFAPVLHAINNYTNQTFMFPKEIYGSFGMDQASWHNIVYNKKSYGFALQAYPYAQTSLANPTNGSEYFLFDGLPLLVVQSGVGAPFNEESFTRNILGVWLGIPESIETSASYSLTPKQSQYGITLGFNQDLSKFCDMAFLRALSFGFSLPIVHVKNQLVFSGNEEILNALQGGNGQAFTPAMNESWGNLILDDNIQQKTSVAVVKFQFDTKYQSEDDIQIATTTFVMFPGAASVTNEVLFQPMLGYNGHIAMGSGITFQFPLSVSQDGISRICMYIGLENKFLLSNNQNRTVEIEGKPYSRYLPLYDRYTGDLVPGVNVFTRNCLVEPFNIINFITGFRLKFKDSVAEIGYELWGKDTEKITINSDNFWTDNRYGIANLDGDCVLQTPQTASQSTINYVVPDVATTENPSGNVYIRARDLTLVTGEGRATIINRVYSSIGYGKNTDYYSFFANFGLFMEVCQNNAALSNWGGWVKTGFTF